MIKKSCTWNEQDKVSSGYKKTVISVRSTTWDLFHDMSPVGCGRAGGVLLAAFGIQFFIGVQVYGTGIIHLSLLDVFQRDDATTSVVGSLFVNLMSITGRGAWVD